MKNKITMGGLDHIVNHLRTRIQGYNFKEVSVEDIGLREDYTLYDAQNAAELIIYGHGKLYPHH